MIVTNQTSSDIYFGPLHLSAGVGTTLTVDDTSATSLYLLDDSVADALNNAYNSGQITVTGAADPFPRPTGEPKILHGSGDPEGLVYAPQGSVYMRRDGTQSNGGVLYMKTSGVTFSTGWLDLATASGATAALPPGTLAAFGGATTPSGWLACDGSAVSRTTYALLFTAVGTLYGAGDGLTTFNLPDLRGRTLVGYAASGGHPDVSTLGNNDGVAEQYRRPKHRHTPHGHGIEIGHGGSGGQYPAANIYNNSTDNGLIDGADGGSGDTNDPLDAPAYLVANYIIKT